MTPYKKHIAAANRRRAKVIKLWLGTSKTQADIARLCQVTPPRVHAILKKEGLLNAERPNA